ncbi:hypothetical protein ACHAXR_004997 [Thalassiosira sp. AJA248-18]
MVIILLALQTFLVATSDAFVAVVPTTTIKASTSSSHQRRLPTLELAAKKKQKSNQRKKQSTSASGKGFGQSNKSPTAILEVNSEGSSSNTSGSPIHADLLTWLKQNPNTFISPKFSIQPSKLGGYGGFAGNSPIKKDELIFRIPRENCVTYDDALSDADCGEAFRLIRDKRVPSWGMVMIAGWIAKEYLLAKEFNDATTLAKIKHWPYLQSVPWSRGTLGQDHILFWSDEEVETLLRGSLAYDDAILIRRTVDSAVQLLSDFVIPTVLAVREELRDQNYSLPRTNNDSDTADILEGLKQAVRGAFVISLSRSFAEEVESDDGTVEVENLLLPLIDVLQHSNTPNTVLEPYEDYIILRARRDIEKGEELFHQYQEENDDVIPPHKFFTRYGFVPGVSEPIAELLERRSRLFFHSDHTNP